MYEPTAAAMSHVLYGTTDRWQEVGPALDAHIKRQAEEKDYEEL